MQESFLLLSYFLHFKTKLTTVQCLQVLIAFKGQNIPIEEILPDSVLPQWKALNKNYFLDILKKSIEDFGFQFIFIGEAQYPSSFYRVERPPLVISYIGVWPESELHKISVVGSREPESRTIEWLEEHLQTCLSANQWLTVSGGAIGIDQYVHKISIRLGQRTLMYLPSGLLKLYPRDLKSWIPSIQETKSCIASEYFPCTEMRKYHFHFRNRLIAAHGHVVFVVQAKMKSGTMVTAQKAIDIGKPVCVIPAFPTDISFSGNLELLGLGIQMIKDANDLSTYMGLNFHTI